MSRVARPELASLARWVVLVLATLGAALVIAVGADGPAAAAEPDRHVSVLPTMLADPVGSVLPVGQSDRPRQVLDDRGPQAESRRPPSPDAPRARREATPAVPRAPVVALPSPHDVLRDLNDRPAPLPEPVRRVTGAVRPLVGQVLAPLAGLPGDVIGPLLPRWPQPPVAPPASLPPHPVVPSPLVPPSAVPPSPDGPGAVPVAGVAAEPAVTPAITPHSRPPHPVLPSLPDPHREGLCHGLPDGGAVFRSASPPGTSVDRPLRPGGDRAASDVGQRLVVALPPDATPAPVWERSSTVHPPLMPALGRSPGVLVRPG